MLMKHIVTKETSNNRLKRKIIAAFAFFDLGDELEKSMPGLIRSLLHQVLQEAPALAGSAMQEYVKQRKSDNSNVQY